MTILRKRIFAFYIIHICSFVNLKKLVFVHKYVQCTVDAVSGFYCQKENSLALLGWKL